MEEQKQRGRPKKLKLVSLDKALEIIREQWLKRGIGEDEVGLMIPAKKTIYNKISAKIMKNHGSRERVLLDEDEVIEKLCS